MRTLVVLGEYLLFLFSILRVDYEKNWISFDYRLLQFKAGCNPANILTEELTTYAMALEDYVKNDPSCPTLLVENYEKAQGEQPDTDDEEEEDDLDENSDAENKESDEEDQESEDDDIDFGIPEVQGKLSLVMQY